MKRIVTLIVTAEVDVDLGEINVTSDRLKDSVREAVVNALERAENDDGFSHDLEYETSIGITGVKVV